MLKFLRDNFSENLICSLDIFKAPACKNSENSLERLAKRPAYLTVNRCLSVTRIRLLQIVTSLNFTGRADVAYTVLHEFLHSDWKQHACIWTLACLFFNMLLYPPCISISTATFGIRQVCFKSLRLKIWYCSILQYSVLGFLMCILCFMLVWMIFLFYLTLDLENTTIETMVWYYTSGSWKQY